MFAGVASALGYSYGGMLATAAAVVALLYAGGVWFGASTTTDRSVILFTHALTVASGPMAGRPVGELFPDAMRAAIDEHCRRALDGQSTRFTCGAAAQPFAVSPVRSAEGAIVYGVLLSGAPADAETSAVMSLS